MPIGIICVPLSETCHTKSSIEKSRFNASISHKYARLGCPWIWPSWGVLILRYCKKCKKLKKKSQKCLLLRNHHSEIRYYLTKIRLVCHNVFDFQQLARKFKYQEWLSFLSGSIKKRFTFDANWHHILR